MKKIILVTGGAGFIGSHLCEKLLKKGNKVFALDNLYSGSINNLKKIITHKDFKFIKGDIQNKNVLEKLIKKVDEVYHLAAILGVSKVVEDPLLTISVNVDGVKNVCEICHKYGNKRIIFSSSSEVYGKNNNIPIKESSNLVFGKTRVARWNYGIGKALAEHIIWTYSRNGLPFVIYRLFNTYGPRGVNNTYSHVIPKFILKSLKNDPVPVFEDGKQTRSFCFVKDVVDGIVKTSSQLNNDVVNIGSDEEITILQLAKIIKRLCKSSSKIKLIKETEVYGSDFESVKRRVPDINKVKESGYLVKTGLEKGLLRTINWVKTNHLY